jgi:hypothetical protein
MISFKADVDLDNGAKATEFIISNLNISTNEIIAIVEGFVNEDKKKESFKKSDLIKEQAKVAQEFQELSQNSEEMTEEKRLRLVELQDIVNTMYEEITKLLDHNEFVVFKKSYHIPYVEKITSEYLIEEIMKQKEFNTKGE